MLNQILKTVDALGLDRAAALRVLQATAVEDALLAVKLLLGINDDSHDAVLRFAIDSIRGQILRYINWDVLPKELENALALMAASYYKGAGFGTTEASTGPVASVKRGDVSVSYATSSGASGSTQPFNLGADGGDFFGWKTVLNEYRKLRW